MVRGRETVPSKEHIPDAEERPEYEVTDIESEELDHETRERATHAGLLAMREALNGIDDYAIFASTGMYLHGLKFDNPEMQALPGDFDATVSKLETLEEIRSRLEKFPGVQFEGGGGFQRIGSERAAVLRGQIKIGLEGDGEMQVIGYPFEIFHNTRMAPAETMEHSSVIGGLRTLNLDGLQSQYGRNLEFELRLGKSVDEVVDFLLQQEAAIRKDAATKRQVLEELGIDEQQLFDFYLHKRRMETADEFTLEAFRQDAVPILAGEGMKTKVAKRVKNLNEIESAKHIDV